MCLIALNKKHYAQSDITVFKILCKHTSKNDGKVEYLSPFRHLMLDMPLVYKIGSNVPFGIEDVTNIDGASSKIRGGFLHVFENQKIAFKTLNSCFYSMNSLTDKYEYFVYEMKIPKGTEYYVGIYGDELCSKELVWENIEPVV